MSIIKTIVNPSSKIKLTSQVEGAKLADVRPIPAHIAAIEGEERAAKSTIAVFYADGREQVFVGPTVGRTEPETRLLPNEDGLL